ncbi:MAG: leucine-rich repeat domain-containing protein [Phycisphaerales bacterium]|nr:MAG: leucine-rich repeat domain-containing protein [Phycisphaerales bacterium]
MRYTIALVLMTVAGAARAGEPVCFEDPKLKAAVERTLRIKNPTQTDMRSLTSLAAKEGIVDLTGIEHAVNLVSLDLHGNQIADISGVSALANLEVLALYDNRISDLRPLSRLRKLRRLSLYSNSISDIRPLGGLTNLVFLDLHRNKITDISAVAGLTKLVNLNLHINRISDISPAASLTSLEIADWHNNRITEITSISDLSKLVHLHLGDNAISDISVLRGLGDLQFLHLGNNKIEDITPLSNLTKLTELALYGNPANAPLALDDKGLQVLVNGSFEERKRGLPPKHIETLEPGRDDITGWEILEMPLGLVSRGQITAGQSGAGIAPPRKTVDWKGPTRWKASDGEHCLDLDGGIRQTVRTVKGKCYEVLFDLAGNPELGPGIRRLCVLVDGRRHDFAFETTGKSRDNLGWITKRVVFTANRDRTKLSFINPTPNIHSAGVALDNVRLRLLEK